MHCIYDDYLVMTEQYIYKLSRNYKLMGVRLIVPKDLAGMNLDERVQHFNDKLGIPHQELYQCSYRNAALPIEIRLEKLSFLIYETLVQQNHEKYFALSHITHGILGLILCEETEIDWDKGPGRCLYRVIAREYSGEWKKLVEETGVELSVISGLRKWVFEHASNGKKAKFKPNVGTAVETWGDLPYSKFDLVKGVKLPDFIDADLAFFLGVAYFGRFDTMLSGISLSFKDAHKPLFDRVVAPIAEDKFNLKLKLRPMRERGFEYYTHSMLVSSWLASYFDYDTNIVFRQTAKLDEIPEENMIDRDAAKEIFLYGIVARRGRIDKLRYNSFRMLLSVGVSAPEATEYVGELAKSLGYTCSYNLDNGIVYFTQGDCRKILGSKLLDKYKFSYPHMGGYVHPVQMGKILKIQLS